MKTLIIYDNSGYIYSQLSVIYEIPQGGIQYLEVDVPDGKYAKSIDVTVTPNIAILKDIPLSETEILKQKVEEQESALIELASLIGGNK